MQNILSTIVMAAGKGTRMQSQLPKVLQQLAGKPLLEHVLQTLVSLNSSYNIIVTGHQASLVQHFVDDFAKQQNINLISVVQQPQLGTGHAIMQAAPQLPDSGITLILSGDVPLISPENLSKLIAQQTTEQLRLLTINLANPFGYGRIVRNEQQQVVAIIEEKDANAQQRLINEVNTGIMAIPSAWLKQYIKQINNNNQQQEYYLTDIIALAVNNGLTVQAINCSDEIQVTGVNSQQQLAQLERLYQQQQAQLLMQNGVKLADPNRIDIRGNLSCGQDVFIDINCIFSGQVNIGNNVTIGANCVISNTKIADNSQIKPFTYIEGDLQQPNSIGENCKIGPFARLRNNTNLADEVHIGNFVELKNTTMGKYSKANHLAYLGDSTIGQKVNYGAGSITANYDGAYKHHTKIEDNVHIGSNSVLVAPVTIGANGTVGASSVITQNTPANTLSFTRAELKQIKDWQRPIKNKS